MTWLAAAVRRPVEASPGRYCCRAESGPRGRQRSERFTAGFSIKTDDGLASLDFTCTVLNLDVDVVRSRVWRALGQDIRIRRHRLSRADRIAILAALNRGATSAAVGAQFGVNAANVSQDSDPGAPEGRVTRSGHCFALPLS
jgi:hypothetical protein